ncbi:hypothetical protein [Actinomadura livida]|uniref:Uncharacterized protein n=1 Tax=Actinomadura livida TaxID=79909 RepID=A0A7W7MV16_9ACTN|nr:MULTISPECIES: hypothetical protein [Actinomadura]MBB4772161.1 hypothetical protein [Actinomadura catellatispora]
MGGVFAAQDDGLTVVDEAEGVLPSFAARSGGVVEMGDRASIARHWPWSSLITSALGRLQMLSAP